MKKQYFYKDSKGVARIYRYCSLCQKGPFTEDQIDFDVFIIDKSMCYCRACVGIILPNSKRFIRSAEEARGPALKTDPKMVQSKKWFESLTGESKKIFEGLNACTSKQIVDKVSSITGEPINISLKSKMSIIRKAVDLLLNHKPPAPAVVNTKPISSKPSSVSHNMISINEISKLSSREIVNRVTSLTGESITVSLKSKALIVKKAISILSSKNITSI